MPVVEMGDRRIRQLSDRLKINQSVLWRKMKSPPVGHGSVLLQMHAIGLKSDQYPRRLRLVFPLACLLGRVERVSRETFAYFLIWNMKRNEC